MRYIAKAYICTNYATLVDTLETDSWYEVQDFVEENCTNGYNCEVTDTERETVGWAYADDFTQQNDLLEDLRLEQAEQM